MLSRVHVLYCVIMKKKKRKEELIVENGIRALQVVIPTISIFALRSALECGSHLSFCWNRAHIRSLENDLPLMLIIFSTKLTAIFAPIRRVCSYHSIETTAKRVYIIPRSARQIWERGREGDTHEEIEVVSEHKNSVFKARFRIFDPCNINISTTSEWVRAIFFCTY